MFSCCTRGRSWGIPLTRRCLLIAIFRFKCLDHVLFQSLRMNTLNCTRVFWCKCLNHVLFQSLRMNTLSRTRVFRCKCLDHVLFQSLRMNTLSLTRVFWCKCLDHALFQSLRKRTINIFPNSPATHSVHRSQEQLVLSQLNDSTRSESHSLKFSRTVNACGWQRGPHVCFLSKQTQLAFSKA